MQQIKNQLMNKFLNQDRTINKTVLVSFITLLIVLVNQVLAIFGVTPAHEDQLVAVINTVLTVLGLLGFVEGPGSDQVTVPTMPKLPDLPTPETKALSSLASQANSQVLSTAQSANVSPEVQASNSVTSSAASK